MSKPDGDFTGVHRRDAQRRAQDTPPPPRRIEELKARIETELAKQMAARRRKRRESLIRAVVCGLVLGGWALAYFYDFKPEDYQFDCETQSICSNYKSQRDTCAADDSYYRCMSIKMGSENFSRAEFTCSGDGTLANKPLHSINFFTCATAQAKAWAQGALK